MENNQLSIAKKKSIQHIYEDIANKRMKEIQYFSNLAYHYKVKMIQKNLSVLKFLQKYKKR